MSNTLQVLRQELARALGSYAAGTATGGSATTLIDAGHASPFVADDPSTLFPERWVLLTSGTNSGRSRRVTTYTPASYQLAWNNPTALTAIAAGDTYELYPYRPDRYTLWINRALERLSYETRDVLSLLTDGDMAAADTAAWSGSAANLLKITAGVPYGVRALQATLTGANGYLQSSAYTVIPQETMWVGSGISSPLGTTTLTVRDLTNTAVICTVTSSERAFLEYGYTFTVPAGCYSIAVRVANSASGAVILCDHIQLLYASQRRYPLPSWVTRRDLVRGIEQLPLRAWGADTYLVHTAPLQRDFWLDTFVDPSVATAYFESNADPQQTLTFLRGIRPFPTLSLDSDISTADKAWVLRAAETEYFREMLQTSPAKDTRRWQDLLSRAASEESYLTVRHGPRLRTSMRRALRWR